MSTIGTFAREGESYIGAIKTLTIKTKASIKPVEKTADRAPDYRVYADGVEIGAAWSMTSKAEKPYLSVKLDDPSFAAPITCRLVGVGEERQMLVWSR
jgi:uncharacterized protein (DUF736 family)